MKEIIHHLQLNIDRMGPVTTLILIDNLQQFLHSGLLLTLNKTPQLKRYLIQFMKHIQTGRFIGVHLQRLMEQMHNSVQMNALKKVLFTNQLNSLLQKTKFESKTKNTDLKNSYEKLITILMDLAYKGQLNTYANIATQHIEIKEHSMFTQIYCTKRERPF
jgi:ribosomal protein L17